MRDARLSSGRGARLARALRGLRGRVGSSLRALWHWDPGARGLPRGLALFLLVFAAGMVVISLVGDQGLVAYWMLRSEERALRSEVARLETLEAELAHEIEALRGDPAYIEQIARRDLGFVRPGEIVVQLPAREEDR